MKNIIIVILFSLLVFSFLVPPSGVVAYNEAHIVRSYYVADVETHEFIPVGAPDSLCVMQRAFFNTRGWGPTWFGGSLSCFPYDRKKNR